MPPGLLPPPKITDVDVAPEAAPSILTVFKSAPSVQEVPSQNSHCFPGLAGCPPAAIASDGPAHPSPPVYCPLFKSDSSVHVEPSQDSVFANCVVVYPE